MTFVWDEIDTVGKEVRLPDDKVKKCRDEISKMLGQEKATLKEIQSIIGLLNFACAVVLPGRPFLRRLIDLTMKVSAPYHRIRLTKEAKSDLSLWLSFLADFNGRSILVEVQATSNFDSELFI